MNRKALYGYFSIALGALFLLLHVLDIKSIHKRAEDYLDRSLKNTTATYVVLRGINAGVSVLKESNLSLAPAGVGLNFALGQALDPIDDITERLSTLVLLSLVSLGTHKLLIEILSDPLMLALGVLFLTSGILSLLRISVYAYVLRLALILLVVRFFFPLTAVVSDYVYSLYVEDRVISIKEELDRLIPSLQSLSSQLTEPSELKNTVAHMTARTGGVADSMATLFLYFAFQTIVLPLLGLWITLRFTYMVARIDLVPKV